MDSNEYKISEIVDDIVVSKATVYNKIANLKSVLGNHIKLRKWVKYIDSKRLEIIKSSIGLSKEEFNALNGHCEEDHESYENDNDSSSQETLETSMKYIESLEN